MCREGSEPRGVSNVPISCLARTVNVGVGTRVEWWVDASYDWAMSAVFKLGLSTRWTVVMPRECSKVRRAFYEGLVTEATGVIWM